MNRAGAASLAGAMLMRGTAKRTRQQIQDELDRLKARMNVGGGANAGDGVRSRRRARTCRAGAAAPGRSAARARIPGGGVRAAEAGTARRHRAAEERADAGRIHRVQPPSRPLSEGRRALHANPRRADRRHRMPPRCSRSSSSIATSMAPRTAQLTVDRRFRSEGDRELATRTVRQLEEPAGRSRASRRVYHGRRPGEPVVSRRPTKPMRSSSPASTCDPRRPCRTIRRCCSATTCWAAAS